MLRFETIKIDSQDLELGQKIDCKPVLHVIDTRMLIPFFLKSGRKSSLAWAQEYFCYDNIIGYGDRIKLSP